jgi:hypothetical protein
MEVVLSKGKSDEKQIKKIIRSLPNWWSPTFVYILNRGAGNVYF